MSRYRLIVLNDPDSEPRVQVVDIERDCPLFDWSGRVARHLLGSGELDRCNIRHCGCYPCDKYLACHLALVAAAFRNVHANLPPDRRWGNHLAMQ